MVFSGAQPVAGFLLKTQKKPGKAFRALTIVPDTTVNALCLLMEIVISHNLKCFQCNDSIIYYT